MSMTFACVPALHNQPDLAAIWEPKLCTASYDPRDIPVSEKTGATMGALCARCVRGVCALCVRCVCAVCVPRGATRCHVQPVHRSVVCMVWGVGWGAWDGRVAVVGVRGALGRRLPPTTTSPFPPPAVNSVVAGGSGGGRVVVRACACDHDRP